MTQYLRSHQPVRNAESKNEGGSCWHQGKCGHVLGGSTELGAVRTELGGRGYLPVKCALQHLAGHQVPQGGEWPVVFSLVRAVAWEGKGAVCLPARVCKVPMQPPTVTSMQEEERVPSLGKRAKTVHTADQSCSYSEKSPFWCGGEGIQKERRTQQMEAFKSTGWSSKNVSQFLSTVTSQMSFTLRLWYARDDCILSIVVSFLKAH